MVRQRLEEEGGEEAQDEGDKAAEEQAEEVAEDNEEEEEEEEEEDFFDAEEFSSLPPPSADAVAFLGVLPPGKTLHDIDEELRAYGGDKEAAMASVERWWAESERGLPEPQFIEVQSSRRQPSKSKSKNKNKKR